MIASALWLVLAILGGLDLPGVRAVGGRASQPGRARGAVHRSQRDRHQGGARHRWSGHRAGAVRHALSAADVEADLEPIRNVRLLNPTQMLSRFTADRGEVAGLAIADLDVDRYTLDEQSGGPEQVLDRGPRARPAQHPQQELAGRAPRIDARVRSGDGTGESGHDRRIGRRTRTSTSSGPSSTSVPTSVATRSPAPTSPRTRAATATPYAGTAGVQMSSFFRRFGVRARLPRLQRARLGGDQQRLADAVGAFGRSIGSQKLAPFLDFDGDPVSGGGRRRRAMGDRCLHVDLALPVRAADRQRPAQRRHRVVGRLQLRAQQRQGGRRRLHRRGQLLSSSTKPTRSSSAWRSAFPDLFSAIDEMPPRASGPPALPRRPVPGADRGVLEVSGRRPANFFSRNGAWSVAQSPPIDRQDTDRRHHDGVGARRAAQRVRLRVERRSGSSRTTRCSATKRPATRSS